MTTLHAARAQMGLQIIDKDAWVPGSLQHRIAQWSPKSDLGRIVRECFKYLPAELAAELIDRITSSVVMESSLALVHIQRNGHTDSPVRRINDHGIVGRKVVTTTGVGFIVDAFQNLVELENMKYHGLGTGTIAENASDTGLGTELTTQYNPDSTRATGTTTESGATVYQTVATNTVDASAAVTEHGIFSAASAGVLLDRTVFSVINLANGDSLQSTYSLTVSAGG